MLYLVPEIENIMLFLICKSTLPKVYGKIILRTCQSRFKQNINIVLKLKKKKHFWNFDLELQVLWGSRWREPFKVNLDITKTNFYWKFMIYRFARAISRLSAGSIECGINPLDYCPTAKIHCTNRHKTQSISTSDNYWSNNSILQWCYNHCGNHYVNYNGLGMVRSDNPIV